VKSPIDGGGAEQSICATSVYGSAVVRARPHLTVGHVRQSSDPRAPVAAGLQPIARQDGIEDRLAVVTQSARVDS